jgi:hypothetical protein
MTAYHTLLFADIHSTLRKIDKTELTSMNAHYVAGSSLRAFYQYYAGPAPIITRGVGRSHIIEQLFNMTPAAHLSEARPKFKHAVTYVNNDSKHVTILERLVMHRAWF